MDAVDLVILDKMTSPDAIIFGGFDPRHAPESMAEKVGLTASSIRKRMGGWRDSGFLVQWHVIPHPAHFGMRHFVGYYSAKRAADRERMLDAMSDRDGAVACFEQVGGLIGFGVYAEDVDAARAMMAPVASIEGVTTRADVHAISLAPPRRPWSPEETSLFKRLRAGPEDSPSTLAAYLGLDEDTVHRTLGSLAESGGLFTVAELDFARFKGVLVRVMFDVDAKDPRAAYEALCKKYDTSFYRDVGTDGHACGHAMVCLRSITLLDELESDIMAIPDVTDVEVHIPRRFRIPTRWLDDVIEHM